MSYFIQVAIASFMLPFACCLLPAAAIAQLTPDGSLGTLTTPVGLINGQPSDGVVGGTAKGNNLFHSFTHFNVAPERGVYFSSPAGVTNILTRVTGTQRSSIEGSLGVLGVANLFLLNPNGISFGSNARLFLGGSLIVSTAKSIQFGDGTEFAATSTQPGTLLSVQVPLGLQYGKSPAAIEVQGNGHTFTQVGFSPVTRSSSALTTVLAPRKTLALIGGSVTLNGADLLVPAGRVELGAVGDDALVSLAPIAQGWAAGYAGVQQFGEVNLINRASVDVTGFGALGAGTVQVQGRSLTLSQGSQLFSLNAGTQVAGELQINTTDSVQLLGVAPDGYASRIETGTVGMGRGGSLNLMTQRLTLQDGAALRAYTFGAGGSGNVSIRAVEAVQISGWSPADPTAASAINTASFSSQSGDVQIDTPKLSILSGGLIASAAFFTGIGGNIVVNAVDVELAGFNPFAPTESIISSSGFGSGRAGNLFINTARLFVRDGGTVSAAAFSTGKGGSVTVNASESIVLQGLFVAPDRIQRSNINASANILPPSTQARLGAPTTPVSDAGSVIVNTPQLNISDGARIGVKNEGIGNGGTMTLNVNRLTLSNQGLLQATTASGRGGNVIVNAGELVLLRRGGGIVATAGNSGNGGNITINSPVVAGFEDSDIVANAVQGRGGKIQITTQGIFGLQFRDRLTPDNDITASSEFGVSGTVSITDPGIDPTSGLFSLPLNLVDSSRQIATQCDTSQGSSFVVTGRGGLPDDPTQTLRSDRSWADTRDLSQFLTPSPTRRSISPPTDLTPPTIVEASTLKQTNGQVELVAVSERGLPIQAATCAGVRP
jgi:filamentous hemagglutinin family protein